MPSPRRLHRTVLRVIGIATMAFLVLGAATACTSSNAPAAVDTATPTTAGGTSPATGSSYEVVSDAVVTAGLADVRTRAAAIKATQTTDPTKADALVDEMYDKWYEFEGTIRKQDKNLYLQMEDGLAAIKAGVEQQNMAKIDKGIADLEEGATNYLKAHP